MQSAKFIERHSGNMNNISVFGQEMNSNTWRLAKMNLAIRGIEANFGETWADSFHNDQHPFRKFDFVMANPPFNISDWGGDKLKMIHVGYMVFPLKEMPIMPGFSI